MLQKKVQIELAGAIQDRHRGFEMASFARICSPLISRREIKQEFCRSGSLSHTAPQMLLLLLLSNRRLRAFDTHDRIFFARLPSTLPENTVTMLSTSVTSSSVGGRPLHVPLWRLDHFQAPLFPAKSLFKRAKTTGHEAIRRGDQERQSGPHHSPGTQ
jgi:hypothetical protein